MKSIYKQYENQYVPSPIELRTRILTLNEKFKLRLTNRYFAEQLNVSETTITYGFQRKLKYIRLRINNLLDEIELEHSETEHAELKHVV